MPRGDLETLCPWRKHDCLSPDTAVFLFWFFVTDINAQNIKFRGQLPLIFFFLEGSLLNKA